MEDENRYIGCDKVKHQSYFLLADAIDVDQDK